MIETTGNKFIDEEIIRLNLLELSAIQGTLEIEENENETRFKGKVEVKGKNINKINIKQGIAMTNAKRGETVIVRLE